MPIRSSYCRKIRPTTHHLLAYLAEDLSQCINRVRQAYGPTPMHTVADRLEIKQAEAHIEHSAKHFFNNQLDRIGWSQALAQYEQTWLAVLVELHSQDKERHAA